MSVAVEALMRGVEALADRTKHRGVDCAGTDCHRQLEVLAHVTCVDRALDRDAVGGDLVPSERLHAALLEVRENSADLGCGECFSAAHESGLAQIELDVLG